MEEEFLWLQAQEEMEKMEQIVPKRGVVGNEVEDGSSLDQGKRGYMR